MESFKLGGYAYDAIRIGANSCHWVQEMSTLELLHRCVAEIAASLDGGVRRGSGWLE